MVDAPLRMSILANMQDLRTKHGMSVVYITHDLAMAYHVASYVLVLHKAIWSRPDPDGRCSQLDPDLLASWSEPPVIRGTITGFRLRAA